MKKKVRGKYEEAKIVNSISPKGQVNLACFRIIVVHRLKLVWSLWTQFFYGKSTHVFNKALKEGPSFKLALEFCRLSSKKKKKLALELLSSTGWIFYYNFGLTKSPLRVSK